MRRQLSLLMVNMDKSKVNWLKSNLITIFYALLIALLIRTFLFQPFFIPSSSMEPGLQIGDRLFASKFDYGYSKHSFPLSLGPISNRIFSNTPERGDVIIFKPPHTNLDYIKRLVGLPGDRIQMKDGNLYINNEKVENSILRRETIIRRGQALNVEVIQETFENGVSFETYNRYNSSYDNTREFLVPEGHYFFLGDNRDASADSREWGFVPFERIVGKAQIIFFSTKDGSTILEFWKWPFDIQINRLFKFIN